MHELWLVKYILFCAESVTEVAWQTLVWNPQENSKIKTLRDVQDGSKLGREYKENCSRLRHLRIIYIVLEKINSRKNLLIIFVRFLEPFVDTIFLYKIELFVYLIQENI